MFYTYDTITPLICCFLLPTTMITTTTITSTTTIIVLTLHITQTKTKTTFQATQCLYYSCPIYFYFLVILLLRECSSCLFSLSFSCCNCYCCAVNIVFVINLMYVFCIHIFVKYAYFCSCLHWLFLFILSSINQIVIYDGVWSYTRHHRRTAPLHFMQGTPATSPSSFVSPTPQFCDKELHPFFFLSTSSVFYFCFMVLTFCIQKDQIDIWY